MAKKSKGRITDARIQELVTNVAGEEAYKIVNFLKGKKDVSEFKVAEKLKFDIQLIRHLLYKLYNYNLVNYIRKKDRQKGWYISYWTFEPRKIKDLIARLKNEKIARFRDRLEEEQANINSFFICPKACMRTNFDKATELSFKCPECGAVLQQQESQKTIDFLKQRIDEMEGEAAAA